MSEQKFLTYITLTQGSSEIASVRNKARAHPWWRKLLGALEGSWHILTSLDKTQTTKQVRQYRYQAVYSTGERAICLQPITQRHVCLQEVCKFRHHQKLMSISQNCGIWFSLNSWLDEKNFCSSYSKTKLFFHYKVHFWSEQLETLL